MLISSALAATLTVPGDYPTIQDAVDAGADGDVVEMTGSFDEDVQVSADLSFEGGATLTGSWTFVDATSTLTDLRFDPDEGRALYIQGGAVSLDTVTLQDGDVGADYGGLIYVREAELTLVDSDLSYGVSARGGAIYGYYADVYVSDSSFSYNESKTDGASAARGGAIRTEYGTTTLSGVSFSNNTCDRGFGGAVSVYQSTLIVGTSTFSDNSVGALYGGALMIWDANATLTDSRFERNQANRLEDGDQATGAAVAVAGSGNTSVLRGAFQDNVADGYGGAFRFYGANGAFDSVVFSSNLADSGGAIYSSSSGLLTVKASSFNQNEATQNGGGIRWRPASLSAQLTIESTTFTQNTVGSYGGGLHGFSGGGVTLHNNIFSNNVAGVAGAAMLNDIYEVEVTSNLVCANEAIGGDGGGVVSFAGGDDGHAFANNLFVENVAEGFGGGLHIADAEPVEVLNNHFLTNGSINGGAGLMVDSTTARAVNNLWAWQTGPAAFESAGTPDLDQGWNAFFENALTAGSHVLDGFTGTEVLEDPRLVDYAADGDCTVDRFYPYGDSPLVDAGDPSIDDPDGSRSDIGAYGGPGADPLLFTDDDGDGWVVVFDCDDSDPDANPDAVETPYDGVDQDCDGADLTDVDGDGFDGGDGPDCDDQDATVHPDAEEVWYDGVDQNCDGANDNDQDGDGFESAGHGGDDCDDTRADVNPAAEELEGDETDSDCDGERDPYVPDTGSPDVEDPEGCGGCGGGGPAGVWLLGALALGWRRRGVGSGEESRLA